MNHLHHTPQPLSLKEGLDIQLEQLKQWKDRLSACCLFDLLIEANHRNTCLPPDATGYDVWRGTHITNFICNWKPNTLTPTTTIK